MLALFFLCADKSGDRLSDESSKKADSDSHPENWTDHEASDPPPPASSPPKQVCSFFSFFVCPGCHCTFVPAFKT